MYLRMQVHGFLCFCILRKQAIKQAIKSDSKKWRKISPEESMVKTNENFFFDIMLELGNEGENTQDNTEDVYRIS